MSLKGKIRTELDFRQSDQKQLAPGQSTVLAPLVEPVVINLLDMFDYGDADDQINVYWHRRLSFTIGEGKSFILDDGSMIDPATGLGVAFDRILVFYVKPVSKVPSPDLVMIQQNIGGASWTSAIDGGRVLVYGGSYLLLVNAKLGWSVGAGNNLLDFKAGISAVECDVLIVGRGTRS